MTADELKASVLQMAIEGRLVPQLDDEPAVDMDADSPDEVPFAIPEKWKWVTIQDVVEKLTDGEHKTPRYIQSGVPFISVKNISSGKLNFNNTKYISIDDYNIYKKRCNPEYGDLLLSKVGTTGVPAIVDTNKNFSLFVSVALLKLKKDIIYNKFIYNAIMSPIVQKQARENTRGVGNKNWVLSAIGKTVFPLPPLAEQRRIVEKLEEILPVIEEYGKAHDALQAVEKALPGKLRASLLQEAISGRLVPQRDDEPAVDIDAETPDDVPFAIPEKWKWCKIEDCCQINPKVTTEDDTEVSFVPMAKLKAGYANYIDTSCKRQWREVKKGFTRFCNGDLVLAKITPCFENRKSAIVVNAYNNIGCGTTEFHVLRCKINMDSNYLLYVLKTSYCISYGVEHFKGTAGQQRLGTKELKDCLIPLPPLAEQRRIVERLNELLPSVEAMDKLYQE